MARLIDWFVAAEDASPSSARIRGLRRLVVGAAVASAGFLFALQDVHRARPFFSSHGGMRLLCGLLVGVAVVFALTGLYGAAFGRPRGADVTSSLVKVAQAVFVLASIGAVFVTLVAFLGVSTPDEPPASPLDGRTFRLPGPNERSVSYDVGDGSITIERVARDSGF